MRIAALSILVPDYDTALDFYVGRLGFRMVQDVPQGDKRWVVVEPGSGSARLVLARAEGPAQQAAIGQQGGGRVWLFLETDDFKATRARMEAAGVAFEEATRHEPYGKVAVWRDPFGNRWDLIQPNRAPE